MELSFGFSPCPNDTYMLGALINGWIDTKEYSFRWHIEDIAKLNAMSRNQELDISKMSFYNYAKILNTYQYLDAGAALGRGCGPLLITKDKKWLDKSNLSDAIVAIPGHHTTANLLLQYAYPEIDQKKEYLFSDIEQALINGDIDLGLIIHENRFTYQNKGLIKVKDLGEYWESKTSTAIPLGCIAVKKSLGPRIMSEISNLVQNSIMYADSNPDQLKPFIKKHSQELDDDVIAQHIALYVNEYSISLGHGGQKSIDTLLNYVRI